MITNGCRSRRRLFFVRFRLSRSIANALSARSHSYLERDLVTGDLHSTGFLLLAASCRSLCPVITQLQVSESFVVLFESSGSISLVVSSVLSPTHFHLSLDLFCSRSRIRWAVDFFSSQSCAQFRLQLKHPDLPLLRQDSINSNQNHH
jgi:hypothetical protein